MGLFNFEVRAKKSSHLLSICNVQSITLKVLLDLCSKSPTDCVPPGPHGGSEQLRQVLSEVGKSRSNKLGY